MEALEKLKKHIFNFTLNYLVFQLHAALFQSFLLVIADNVFQKF